MAQGSNDLSTLPLRENHGKRSLGRETNRGTCVREEGEDDEVGKEC